MEAAIRVLVEDGYAKFSASRVAASARVSRGAQEHYFPTKNALIAAAAKHAMREAVKHAEALAERTAKSSDPIERFLVDSEHFFFSPVYRSMTEIAFAARYDPTLARIYRPIVKDARAALDAIWIGTLGAAGYPRKNIQQFIDLTHYLLRGVFFASIWLPYRTDRRALLKVWKQLAPSMLSLDR